MIDVTMPVRTAWIKAPRILPYAQNRSLDKLYFMCKMPGVIFGGLMERILTVKKKYNHSRTLSKKCATVTKTLAKAPGFFHLIFISPWDIIVTTGGLESRPQTLNFMEVIV